MSPTIDWGGVSQQFRRVHARDLDAWLDGYTAGTRPPWLRLVPREPLAIGAADISEVVTAIEMTLKEVRKYDRSGPIGRDLTVMMGPGSAKVLADWDERHGGTTLEEFNWLPSFQAQKTATG